MNITKKNEYNYDPQGSNWSEIIWYYNLRHLEDVKEDLDAIKKFIDFDFKNLTNEEFYILISRFYSIYITKNDILNFLAKINDVKYDKFEKLNSRMTFKDIVREGHGKDFSWWEETFQIGWIVATAEDLTLNPDYNYSTEEIYQMIKNKKIVSFGNYSEPVGINPELPYQQEDIEKIDFPKIDIPKVDFNYGDSDELLVEYYNTYFDFNNLGKGESEFSDKVYKIALSTIRKRLNKKKVLNDCKQIILFLNNNIHLISDAIQANPFISKDEKNKYLDLQEELYDKHKTLSLTLTPKV